ncbi:hypothetical protein BDV95DRAFT_565754 [Massariosphaeria phaeospora]|uniref:Major facilitator superfamily (MFS) profile domain-containing protein n=1 Tax=Massariosphaeria phaeospora TaxID=100035 RepID=A0A7C8MFQ2_9PLEO|nr:hypothetical protein BDV95DRAFT_565754 [Massariosphaeria phaeospora]
MRVTLFACFMTYIVQINGTAMTGAIMHINEALGIDDHSSKSAWLVWSWFLSGEVAAAVGLPFMERRGVRWLYLYSFTGLTFAMIIQAVLKHFKNYYIFLSLRVLAGGLSGVLANATSVIISNLWKDRRQTRIFTCIYTFALFAGHYPGPATGAFVAKRTTWDCIFLFLATCYYFATHCSYVWLVEVRRDVIYKAQALGNNGPSSAMPEIGGLFSDDDDVLRPLLRSFRRVLGNSSVFSVALFSVVGFGFIWSGTVLGFSGPTKESVVFVAVSFMLIGIGQFLVNAGATSVIMGKLPSTLEVRWAL